jgi:hypothetical protein
VPSGLLHDENVIFYHPLDDFTEYTKGLDWSSYDGNSSFVPGILTSGIQLDPGNSFDRIVYPASTYDSIASASGFTTAMWVSGFLTSDTIQRLVSVGMASDGGVPADKDSAILYKIATTTGFNTAARLDGTFGSQAWTPPPSNDTDWHLFIIDIRYEGTGWRHRVSLDGADWLDLGVDAHGGNVTSSVSRPIIRIDDSTTATIVLDEVVFWGGNDLFTSQELSNLYELYNTYNATMNQYTSTFGTPTSGNTDCFIEGHTPVSGNISLYMLSQTEKGSVDLFLSVSEAATDNVNLFINGYTFASGITDHHIHGHLPASGDIDMVITASVGVSGSSTLYTQGPTPSSGDTSDFIWGHLPISGDSDFFIQGSFPRFDAFVATAANNPSNILDLFVNGVPSGASTIFYTNDSVSLFIIDRGIDTTVGSEWTAFTRVADSIATSGSGVWSSFVKGGNTSNKNSNLYIGGHASGDAPHGISITLSGTLFINGQSFYPGDEGLLDEGYLVDNTEIPSFAKVHSGVVDTTNLYTSGGITVVSASSTLDLFTFGVLGIPSGAFDSYTLGHVVSSGNCGLFVLGIQGIPTDTTTLYIEVTDIGLFNRSNTLYSHGF